MISLDTQLYTQIIKADSMCCIYIYLCKHTYIKITSKEKKLHLKNGGVGGVNRGVERGWREKMKGRVV